MNSKETIWTELNTFDAEVLSEFKENYGEQIEEFVNYMVAAESKWREVDAFVEGSEERSYFSAVLFWAFSSLLHSFKLLCYGYQVPAGNLMRQSIEAIAFSVYATDKSNGAIRKLKAGKISTNKALVKLNKVHIRAAEKINFPILGWIIATEFFKIPFPKRRKNTMKAI